jgi:hypothetical protein
MAEQITLNITWTSIVNACVDALQNPDAPEATRRDIRTSMCQMARVADAAVEMQPQLDEAREQLRRLRQNHARLISNYRFELGLGLYEPSDIAKEFGWE